MTKPDISVVYKLEDGELDAAVSEFVMDRPIEWKVSADSHNPCLRWSTRHQPVPRYSDPHSSSFYNLLEKLQEKEWDILMDLYGGISSVRLTKNRHKFNQRTINAYAPTLPLALARAAMLTTYTDEEIRHAFRDEHPGHSRNDAR